jgi:hypothetical protein
MPASTRKRPKGFQRAVEKGPLPAHGRISIELSSILLFNRSVGTQEGARHGQARERFDKRPLFLPGVHTHSLTHPPTHPSHTLPHTCR